MREQIYSVGIAITKHDMTDIVHPRGRIVTDAIYCGGAGVVVVVWGNGTTSSFTVVAGQILPVAAKRVNSTDTTGTLLIALYNV